VSDDVAECRFAVIMFTDMVGYSELAQRRLQALLVRQSVQKRKVTGE
jgi:class 3 adenylate cyclase